MIDILFERPHKRSARLLKQRDVQLLAEPGLFHVRLLTKADSSSDWRSFGGARQQVSEAPSCHLIFAVSLVRCARPAPALQVRE